MSGLSKRSHRAARLWRPRHNFEPAMADRRGCEGQGQVGAESVRPLGVRARGSVPVTTISTVSTAQLPHLEQTSPLPPFGNCGLCAVSLSKVIGGEWSRGMRPFPVSIGAFFHQTCGFRLRNILRKMLHLTLQRSVKPPFMAEEAGVEPTEDAWRPPTGLKPARVTGPDALPRSILQVLWAGSKAAS